MPFAAFLTIIITIINRHFLCIYCNSQRISVICDNLYYKIKIILYCSIVKIAFLKFKGRQWYLLKSTWKAFDIVYFIGFTDFTFMIFIPDQLHQLQKGVLASYPISLYMEINTWWMTSQVHVGKKWIHPTMCFLAVLPVYRPLGCDIKMLRHTARGLYYPHSLL